VARGDDQRKLFESVLVLVELTELAARVPAGAREQWALDCAKRACGDDFLALDGVVHSAWWDIARWRLGHRLGAIGSDSDAAALRQIFEDMQASIGDAVDSLRDIVETQGPGHGRARAVEAMQSVVWALRCADGHPDHEAAARTAQRAFEDPHEEAGNQARRLLMRSKLTPTGAELLVRLDYAESLGALPRDPDQRAWLDAQRELLMNEDEAGRLAVVFRHLDAVFLAELARAR
jgi:hypothetical protein